MPPLRRVRSSTGSASRSLAALALCLFGCRTPTQLLVVVDTDLEPGTEARSVEVAVTGERSNSVTHTFDLSEVALPFSFGVRPAEAADEAVAVEARVLDAARLPRVHRRVLTGYVAGRTLRVELPLARACMDLEPGCPEGETCAEGRCVSESVDPEALPEGSPDEALAPLFEGPRTRPDGGLDDGGPPVLDAGPPCVEGAACASGDPCRPGVLLCGPSRCEPGAPLDEGASCGDGRSCNAEGRCG